MKPISADLVATIIAQHGYAELEWTRSIPIPGDPDFPVLQLPEDRLRYSTTRGFPVKLAARRTSTGSHLLFVQFESFDIGAHQTGTPSWAVPGSYTPSSDDEAIHHELGFDEGWDDAEAECMFACDQRFSVFWRAVQHRRRFGLTVAGTESLYPVTLDKPELVALKQILGAWPRPE